VSRGTFYGYTAAALLGIAAEIYLLRLALNRMDGLLATFLMAVSVLVILWAVLWRAGVLPAIIESWGFITRRQILLTFLLGCAYAAFRVIVSINVKFAPFIFVGDQMKAFALLLTIVAVDRLTGKDPDRREAYALAVLLYAAVVLQVTTLAIRTIIRLLLGPLPSPVGGGFGLFLNNFFELLVVAGAITWVINDRRKARRERDGMHAAELSRIEAERQSVESDLQAMQARVEPHFLFNTLAHVKRAYVHNATQGAEVLDALIAYLRAAMPKMRDSSSTIGQELDLVRAYLEIVKVRLGDRLAFAIAPPGEDLANARMPAMLMLPLVDHAITSSVGEWHSAGSIDLRAAVVNDKIRLELSRTGTADAAETDERILAIRERLAAIYAGDASLVMRRAEPDLMQAVLEIPHERAAIVDPVTA
jgi:hypothetical protein